MRDSCCSTAIARHGSRTVAALLVDDALDRLAVVRHGLVRPVDVRLLQDLVVEAPHGKALLHRPEVVRGRRRQRRPQLRRRRGREPGLPEEQLRGVRVRHAQPGGEVVVGEPGAGLGVEEASGACGEVGGGRAAVARRRREMSRRVRAPAVWSKSREHDARRADERTESGE